MSQRETLRAGRKIYMKFRAMFLVATAFDSLVANPVFAGEIIRCHQKDEVSNQRFINELVVYETEQGGYAYYAQRCIQNGRYCEGNAIDCQRADYVSREFYNGHPTLIFKGDGVSIAPLCAGMIAYQDEASPAASFAFRRDECVVANH